MALDLSRVTEMDAHGLGVLAELCASLRHEGCALLLAAANDRVDRLLRLTRLDTVIPRVNATYGHVHPTRHSSGAVPTGGHDSEPHRLDTSLSHTA